MNNIRRIRKAVFGVSQAHFAGFAGVTQATVSRWEAGQLVPSLLELTRIREEAKKRGLKLKAEEFFAHAALPVEQRRAS
jgi:DNA-binding transcriptional regulator YiaG